MDVAFVACVECQTCAIFLKGSLKPKLCTLTIIYRKIKKIRISKIISLIVPNMEQFGFTVQLLDQKVQMECQTV